MATDNEDTILEVSSHSRSFLLCISAKRLTCAVARLKAYWETEHAAAQKEKEKREQAVLNRWTKLVQGLRIRQRVREQYGGGTYGSGTLGVGDVDSSPTVASGNADDHDGRDDEDGVQPATVGGFITGVEDVVQRYSLPRPTHVVFSSPPRSPNSNGSSSLPAIVGSTPGSGTSSRFPAAPNNDDDDDDDEEAGEERGQQVPPMFLVEDLQEVEMDYMNGLELEGAQQNHDQSTQRVRRTPKSMAALAAEAEALLALEGTTTTPLHKSEEGEEAPSSTASRPLRSVTRSTPRTKPKTQQQSRTRPKAKTKTKTKTAAAKGTTPSRNNNGQGRKKRARRTRQDHDDDDDDHDDDDDDSEAAAAAAASGLDFFSESGSDGDGDGGRPRVAKRARKHGRGSPADATANDGVLLAPVPPSDRVLRTRKGKSPALLA